MREEDAGGSEAGAPSDLKMPLENGRADERVSRGQASERAVCVCEAVSVEKGARRPPMPAAVVCPPGGPPPSPRHNRVRHLCLETGVTNGGGVLIQNTTVLGTQSVMITIQNQARYVPLKMINRALFI